MRSVVAFLGPLMAIAVPAFAFVDPEEVVHARLRGGLSLTAPTPDANGQVALDVKFTFNLGRFESATGRVRCRPLEAGGCVGRRGRVIAARVQPSHIPGARYAGLEDVDLDLAFDDVPLTCTYTTVTIDYSFAALSGPITCHDASGSQQAAGTLMLVQARGK